MTDAMQSSNRRGVQTFEVWSVSKEGFAELATQRSGMGPTDFEQYRPTTDDVFVRWADYERLRAALERIRSEWDCRSERCHCLAIVDSALAGCSAVETTEQPLGDETRAGAARGRASNAGLGSPPPTYFHECPHFIGYTPERDYKCPKCVSVETSDQQKVSE